VESITDPRDPRVAAFTLTERGLTPRPLRSPHPPGRADTTPTGLFVAEGDLVVERALSAGCRALALLASPRYAETIVSPPRDTAVYVADDDVRRQVTGLGVPLDVVGLFERPPAGDIAAILDTARHVVVVDCIDNPTNVGAIVRSATALGADALLLDRTSADPLTRRALRVSMGAALVLPTARYDDGAAALLAHLDAAGFATVALTPDPSATPLDRLPTFERAALVLGSERSGLDDEVAGACSHRARIPMAHGIDSLNVAAAAAVACFAVFGGR
jgi:tRNA G18 (ribose-2'-O)-methylase SpoU